MRRDQLEHAIRAATAILGEDAVVIIGSQAILGSYPDSDLPQQTVLSMEVDVLPLDDDDETKADELDGAIGELSSFHRTHGFYVQGVGQRTAILPAGWRDRLIAVRNSNTEGRTGWCLEGHDLCVAKLAADRGKDRSYCLALIRGGLVSPPTLRERLAQTDLTPELRARVEGWLAAIAGAR